MRSGISGLIIAIHRPSPDRAVSQSSPPCLPISPSMSSQHLRLRATQTFLDLYSPLSQPCLSFLHFFR
ncbi:hypothetical protein E2C01_014086 [Portunus trituberculatus]|uniref:Uncharacterized protein n=1 Tax=Portunus trituberculatus TaxID=210409 RepID=A0A5B7DI96_PORTR|nr:hypothetical protein [Portunus trituberculatus]